MLTQQNFTDLVQALQDIRKELRRIGDCLDAGSVATNGERAAPPKPLEAIAMQLGTRNTK